MINTLPVFLALPVPPYGTDPCLPRRWEGVDSCPIFEFESVIFQGALPAVRAVQSCLSFSLVTLNKLGDTQVLWYTSAGSSK